MHKSIIILIIFQGCSEPTFGPDTSGAFSVGSESSVGGFGNVDGGQGQTGGQTASGGNVAATGGISNVSCDDGSSLNTRKCVAGDLYQCNSSDAGTGEWEFVENPLFVHIGQATNCCGGEYVILNDDPNNCGTCGNKCSSGICNNYVCTN